MTENITFGRFNREKGFERKKRMAAKILSIEVGNYETRVVEMDYKTKAPKIYRCFTIPTPEYMVRDGSIELNQEFAAAFRTRLKEYGIRTKKAIFVLNSARIASREITIPLVKESKIHELLMTNSAEYFPVDLVQYRLVHRIIEKDTKENKYKLSVLAVPNEMIKSYEALADALGLQLETLDYIGNSISQAMIRFLPQEVKVSVKADETSAIITVVNGNNVELQRTISYGILEAVEVVMEHPDFGEKKTYEQALERMRSENCLVHEEVAENLTPLIGNICRIVDYYTGRNQEVVLNEIWLFGIGAECVGLKELLAKELNMQVLTIEKLPNQYTLTKSAAEMGFSVTNYAICVAAAIAPLKFTFSHRKQGEVAGMLQPQGELGYSVLVCGVCVTFAIVLLLYSVVTTNMLKNENAAMQKQIDELSDVQVVYDTYTSTKTRYDAVISMYELTNTPNDSLLAFLGEMEEKMPAEISVASLTAGKDGVNMTVSVSSKAAAAKVLMQLRGFETLSSVDTPAISESEDSGRAVVTFSIYCTYATE